MIVGLDIGHPIDAVLRELRRIPDMGPDAGRAMARRLKEELRRAERQFRIAREAARVERLASTVATVLSAPASFGCGVIGLVTELPV